MDTRPPVGSAEVKAKLRWKKRQLRQTAAVNAKQCWERRRQRCEDETVPRTVPKADSRRKLKAASGEED